MPTALLYLLLVGSLALSGCQPAAVEDRAFGERVRAYLLAHPEVLEQMSERLQARRQNEAALAAVSEIKKNRNALERDVRDFVANPSGKVTVVEFYDYQCGYCKMAAPHMAELIRAHPDVRFVFKEFTIFGPVSEYAARMVMAAQASGKYLDLHLALMAEKPLSLAAVDRIVAAQGLDVAALRKTAQAPAVSRRMADVQSLAHTLRLEGTPAFVVGDLLIPGADMEAVEAAIRQAKGRS